MKRFLAQSAYFIIFLCITGEIIIRIFHLAPDIPERYIDKYGIQRYKPDQSGFYTRAKERWKVNRFGWLGPCDTDKDTVISIIGDSYIENIMNPVECNQANILKSSAPGYSFFEAGRSGVTFIEAMELSKILDIEITPDYQLLYLSEDDFYESVSEITRYNDRLQLSVETGKLLPNQLKSPGIKKILYNIKLLYYLYLKFPVHMNKGNKGEPSAASLKNSAFDDNLLNKLFLFCADHYDLHKLIFVFHPGTDKRIVTLADRYVNTILLNSNGDRTWELSDENSHWSCYGHKQVSSQVEKGLKTIIKPNTKR